MENELMTLKDLKARYHCSNDKLYELLSKPDFPAFRLTDTPKSRWYVRKNDLDKWERQRCKLKNI